MQLHIANGLALAVFSVHGTAETIISVAGTPNAGDVLTSTGVGAVSWTQSTSFHDVEILALVDSAPDGASDIGTAYLTTGLGPGTTLADQIASTSFPIPSTNMYVLLFSGLTLGPGTYYLSLTSTGGIADNEGAWACVCGGGPSVVLGAGVSRNPGAGTEDDSIYPPGGTVFPFPEPANVIHTVAEALEVPEPSTLGLLGVGVLISALIGRKNRE